MNVKWLNFTLFVLLILPTSLIALDPGKAITQYVHDVWGKEQGLPQMSARYLVQTDDGYLWIGTDDGLARFDGVRFAVFGPRTQKVFHSGWIQDLYKDPDGSLWIATRGRDLIRYQNGEFVDYAAKFGLTGSVRAITHDSKGTIWIGTDSEVGQIQNSRFVPLKDKTGFEPKKHDPIFFDESGQLWVDSYRWINGAFERSTDFPANVAVLSIAQDRSGILWFGTEGQGLISYNNGKFDLSAATPSQNVRTILQDRDANLWTGTNGGLFRIQNGKTNAFDSKQGLSDDQVVSLLEDTEGNLWVGTQAGGLNRFRDGTITPFSVSEGLSAESPFCVYEDREGAIWIGSSQGLDRYKDGKFTAFTTKEGLPGNEVLSLWQDREGSLWVGTDGGLGRFQNGKFTNFTTKEGLSGNVIFAIFEDGANVLWISTIGGISQYRNGTFQTVYTPKKRRPSPAIVESPDGSIWIALFGSGIMRFQNGEMTGYSSEQGLTSNMALSLHMDQEGTLWIGTFEDGLNRFRNGKFTQYTSENGLHHDSIYRILEDDHENLWMSSNEGIFRVNKKELNDFADGKTKTIHSVAYGKSDGMRNVECNGAQQPAGWKSRDGKLWFPTAKGIVRLDPNHLPFNRTGPPVHLEELLVDEDQSISLETKPNNPSIPPSDGRLEFHYTGISLSAPEKIRFQYKLEGLDKNWVDASNRRVAYYTNISPGNYTFHVKAANADGVWNEAGAAIPFRLEPHFYQTYWFYGLCVLSILYAGWQIQGFRLRRMLELEKIRMRIATDLHDDIGAGLTQISILSELTRREPEQSQQNDSLERIAESSRELIQSMSDIVWAVDPKKDHLQDLVLRMRKFANDLLASKNIPFRFQTDSLDEQREVDPSTRRHLYLIYKESINNLVRHSGCTEAEISLRGEGSNLILIVKDNGKGIVSSQEDSHDGHGLRSMKQRAKEIGGKLEIDTATNSGTTITLRAPL